MSMKTIKAQDPLVPNTLALAKNLQSKRVTHENVVPGPGWVLCRIPDVSSSIVVAGTNEEGMPADIDPKAPIEVVKIGKPPLNQFTGQPMPEPWFKEGDMVYAPGRWVACKDWGDDRLVLVGRDDILARYRSR